MDQKNENPTMETATVPLAYHEVCMNRNHKTVLWLLVCWAVSIILVVAAFVYLWLQYDYVSYADNTGVYVVTDSQGNVIASDLAPEDVIRIMEDLNDGKDAQSPNP